MPVNIQPKRLPQPRPREDVVAMALVAQVNAVQLLLAAHRRGLTDAPRLESPGAVREFREALIDWRTVKTYSEADLLLRAHQVWGQHCLFCWAFYCVDPYDPPPYAQLEPEHQIRCGRQLTAKLDRIVHEIKTLQQELSRRTGDELVENSLPPLAKKLPVTESMPTRTLSGGLRTGAERLVTACEYAGMLAAARWMADIVWRWDDPEIMNPDAKI